MSGVKGRSGRRKTRKQEIEDAFETVRGRIPDFFQSLADMAVGIYVVMPGKDGEPVRAYQKPPDKEAATYLIDREYGKPRISLDQRLKTEVELDPSKMLEAMRRAREDGQLFLAGPERQLPIPTRDISHDPVIDAPFCEGKMSDNFHCANPTDSVGIPPGDLPPTDDDAP